MIGKFYHTKNFKDLLKRRQVVNKLIAQKSTCADCISKNQFLLNNTNLIKSKNNFYEL